MSLIIRKFYLFILILLGCSLSSGCQIGKALELHESYKAWNDLNAYSYSFDYQYGCSTAESCADTQRFVKLTIKVDEEGNKTAQTETGVFIDRDQLPKEWHILKMNELYLVLLSQVIDDSAGEIRFGKAGNIIQGGDFYITNFDYIKQPSLDKIAKLKTLNKVKALWDSHDNTAYTYELNANCHYFKCDGFNDPYLKARVINKKVTNVQALDHVTPTSFNKNVTTMERIFALLKDEILRGKDSAYSYDPVRANITQTRHYTISKLEELSEWKRLTTNMDKMLSVAPNSYILKYIVDCYCEPIHNFHTVHVENNRIIKTIVNDVNYGADPKYGLLLIQLFRIAQSKSRTAHHLQIDYHENGMLKYMNIDTFEYFENDEYIYRDITLEPI